MSAAADLDPTFATITDLGERLARRDLSPVDVVEALLERLARHNDELRVYITVTRDAALAQARQAEAEIRSGLYRGPLHGIPISLKDSIQTRGIRTTYASGINPEWVPEEDAVCYARLREAGAVLLGKANLDEFGISSHPAFPPPLNPWRADRTSGGSSSGSAVSVAAGLAYGSLGTDTGGSGRYPAHVNGVVGFMATAGRVSRRGALPNSDSLGQVTVLARSVADSAVLLQAIAGYDPSDARSTRDPIPDLRSRLGSDIRGLRLGYARGYTYEDIDPDVVSVTHEALMVLRRLGAMVEEVRLPYLELCVPLLTTIVSAELATSYHHYLRAVPERLGQIAVARLDLGSVIPAVDYIHAQQVRQLLREAFGTLFQTFDLIVGPARATRAGPPMTSDPASATTRLADGREIDVRSVAYEYSGLHNLLGTPAIVVPAGFSREGTPIGVQFAGKWFDEVRLLQVAHAFEQATEWHHRRAPPPAGA